MITNDVQMHSAAAHIRRLRSLLEELHSNPVTDDAWGVDGRQFEITTVEGQIEEYESEISEYESLKRGDVEISVQVLPGLDALPSLLIRKRIARGFTQRDLAERLNLKEQQIQRYEATQYESASLGRLVEVATALEPAEENHGPEMFIN